MQKQAGLILPQTVKEVYFERSPLSMLRASERGVAISNIQLVIGFLTRLQAGLNPAC